MKANQEQQEDEEEEKQEYLPEEDQEKLLEGKIQFIKIKNRSNGDEFTITPNTEEGDLDEE